MSSSSSSETKDFQDDVEFIRELEEMGLQDALARKKEWVAYDSSNISLGSKLMEISVTVLDPFGADSSNDERDNGRQAVRKTLQLARKVSMNISSGAGVVGAKIKQGPLAFGVLALMVPFAVVIGLIRFYREYKYEAKVDQDDHYASTLFEISAKVSSRTASWVFALLIGITLTLDVAFGALNKYAAEKGHVYVQLAQSLYQELMILGMISFTIVLMNTEGYFKDKYALFHSVEYAHIVIFLLGLGLVQQGITLAVINSEVKTAWKFSVEQSLEEIEAALNRTRDASYLGWGPWRIRHGLTRAKRHLDIHLVTHPSSFRVAFALFFIFLVLVLFTWSFS